MSLFEKLNNKRYNLQEAKSGNKNKTFASGSFDPANQEGKFVKNEAGKNLSKTSNSDINKRLSASTTKGDQARSLYGTEGGSTEGTAGPTTTTKPYKTPSKKKQLEIQNRSTLNKLQKGQGVNVGTPKITGDVVKQSEVSKAAKEFTDKINKKNKNLRKGVDYFFDADKAKKQRDAFQAGRKAYTTSKTGIKAGTPTKQGIINYIAKARTMRQGSNASVKANKKAAEIIYKSSGQQYAEKIRKKYETDKNLARRRPSNAPTYAQVKAKIDAKEKAMRAKAKTKLKTVLKVAEKGKKGTSAFPGFDEIPKKSTEGRRIAKQFATAKQLTGEPTKPLTRFQKIKKAVTTGWKIPKDTGNFIEKTRGAGTNITKTLTRKSYKPNLLGTVAKNLDKVPNRYKALAAAGLIGYGLIGRNKTAKADAKGGGAGAVTPKKKIMKYTTGTTTLKLGSQTKEGSKPDF